MSKKNFARAAGLSMAAAVLFVASGFSANPAPVVFGDCEVKTEEEVTARAGEQELKVTLSEEMEGELTAKFDDEAKITVASVARDVDGSVTIKLDAGAAAAGTWALTLSAGEAKCSGDVRVIAAGDDVR